MPVLPVFLQQPPWHWAWLTVTVYFEVLIIKAGVSSALQLICSSAPNSFWQYRLMMVNDQQGFIMRWFLVLQAAPDNYRKRLLTSGYCPGVIVHVHSQRCFAVKLIQGLHKDPVMVPKRLGHPCKSGRGEAQAGDGALIFRYPYVSGTAGAETEHYFCKSGAFGNIIVLGGWAAVQACLLSVLFLCGTAGVSSMGAFFSGHVTGPQ